MIRVNLLPGYVAQRRLTRRMIWAYSIVFVLIVTAMMTWTFGFEIPTATKAENDANEAVANKERTDALKTQATQVTADIQPTLAKLNFVKAVHDYNVKWVKLYDTVARYTDLKVIYSGAAVSGQTMQIKAYAPSIAEMGRYLEEIYNEPDFNTVSIDHLPGYPEAIVKKYYLDGKLIGISSPSTGGNGGGGGGVGYTGGGQAGGGAFAGGFGGPRGGGFGGPPSGFGGGGYPGGGGGFGGGYPGGGGGFGGGNQMSNGFGEHVWSVEEVLQDQINPLATPQQRERIIQRALTRVKVKQEPKGFDVNITATLKQPLTPPAPPGESGGGAAGGPGGGYPGGGFPGGPPGGYGGPPPGMGGPRGAAAG